jgi:hypothetical protein
LAISTIKASGGDYTSLAAWEAANQADITGLGPEEAECYDLDDTTSCAIAGWTTTASDYVRVYAVSASRNNGVANESSGTGYRRTLLTVQEDFVRVEGIEIYPASSSSSAFLINTSLSASCDVQLTDCLLIWDSGTTTASYLVNVSQSNVVFTMTNCILTGPYRGIDSRNAATVVIDHCVIYGEGSTNESNYGTVVDSEATVTNTFSGGHATEDFWTGGAAPSGSHNASEDASAATDFTNTQTSLTMSDQFTSPGSDGASMDFTLLGTGVLDGNGTGSLANDIAGSAYPSPSDIGCHAYAVAGGPDTSGNLLLLGVG